ncbi:MAG: Lysine--tRNA ligase [Phycisphaerae bacterium]|nr:Lysine--tRNA ligase [Phycisphaerae bacterium]
MPRARPTDSEYALRFECFVNGMEMGNAYSELNDPAVQRETLAAQLRGEGDETMAVMDEDFCEALEYTMPPAFEEFSARGAYPIAQARPEEPWERVADFLRETVILRAIQHDLRLGPRGQKRDENLLAEVFRLACRYIGQSPKQALYLEELRTASRCIPPLCGEVLRGDAEFYFRRGPQSARSVFDALWGRSCDI